MHSKSIVPSKIVLKQKYQYLVAASTAVLLLLCSTVAMAAVPKTPSDLGFELEINSYACDTRLFIHPFLTFDSANPPDEVRAHFIVTLKGDDGTHATSMELYKSVADRTL